MAKIYPRLELFEYEEKIQFVENQLQLGGIYKYKAIDSDLHWLPMGNRAELKEIETLRDNIISFMHDEKLNTNTSAQERIGFDRKLGLKLLKWVDITPSIAADNGMWAYMNIVLVPELIKTRWGFTERGEFKTINHEHYYDTNRSYLKKLWFTAYLINDEGLYTNFKQDEIDVWYDNAFNRGLDNYIQNVHYSFYRNIEVFNVHSDLRDLYRQFIKSVNRKLAYINYYALTESSIDSLLDTCFNNVYQSYMKDKTLKQNI